jgi:hypothetical protein
MTQSVANAMVVAEAMRSGLVHDTSLLDIVGECLLPIELVILQPNSTNPNGITSSKAQFFAQKLREGYSFPSIEVTRVAFSRLYWVMDRPPQIFCSQNCW